MELPQAESMEQVALSALKSPVRILVRRFRSSRDNWKQKCLQAKNDIKRFKNKAADAVRSRDQWKQKFEHLQERTESLEAERVQLRAESQVAAEVKKKPSETMVAAR